MTSNNKKAIATEEAVLKACDELLNRGTYPTQAKIREYLGGGSPVSINKYQQVWRDKIENDPKTHTATFLPKSKEIQQLDDKYHAEMIKLLEPIIVDERLHVLHAETERLRDELAEKDKKLMGYDEMKAKQEVYDKIQAELMAKVGTSEEKYNKENKELREKISKMQEDYQVLLNRFNN